MAMGKHSLLDVRILYDPAIKILPLHLKRAKHFINEKMISSRKLLSSSNGLNFVHKITYKPFIAF